MEESKADKADNSSHKTLPVIDKEFIIPQKNPRSDCAACLYGNFLLKPCGHRYYKYS